MRPHQARFVTACQQLLAFGVVLVVLTPASAVVSLDVIGLPGSAQSGPATAAPSSPSSATSANQQVAATERPDKPAESRATVPVGTVEPTVTEVPLTAPEPQTDGQVEEQQQETEEQETDEQEAEPAEEQPGGEQSRTRSERPATPAPATAPLTSVTSDPQPVEGYGGVGVTWSHADEVEESDILLEVRTQQDGAWSGWTELEYHDDHAPAPESPEGQHARPGTDPLFVGEVDLVQLRATSGQGLPADLQLAVIEPGTAEAVTTEAPELAMEEPAEESQGAEPEGEDALELQASDAPRPTIYSRAQWGADERLRDGSPRYGTISAGFVHHTVNSNSYSRAEVPGIIRSIYAYHTRSRGWSDIGYNFLVDKYGRIWEGRYGGVSRAVIGAHTLGYNEYSFAMSAIGNFETVRAPDVMLRAYGDLFAWKLGLHGVNPADTSQRVGGSTFKAINGHRDAGSTACPGRYLYAELDVIRMYATEEGESTPAVEFKQLDSNLAGTPYPDLVVRRASDGRGMILPTGGLTRFARPSVIGTGGWSERTIVATPDVTRDGLVDLVTFDETGAAEIRPGLADGRFGATVRRVNRFRGHSLVAAVGDVDGDSHHDLVARRDNKLVVFLGNRRGGFDPVRRGTSLRGYRQVVGAGDVTGDGHADLWARNRQDRLFLHRGLGGGAFGAREAVAGDWSGYDWVDGGVDYSTDGVPDLLARRKDGRLMVFPGRGDGTLAPAVGPARNIADITSFSGAGQLAGNPSADLVATRADGALVVLRNRGGFELGRPIDTGRSFRRGNLVLNAGDFDGNGHGDVIMRRGTGALFLYPGRGTGRLGSAVKIAGRKFRHVTGLRAVRDVTGDGSPDLVGKDGQGVLTVWPGNGRSFLGQGYAVEAAADARESFDRSRYTWSVPVSDLRRRGAPDLVVRDQAGLLYWVNGSRKGMGAPRYLGEAMTFDLGG